MGSDVAEAQIDGLSDAEIDVLLEIYEVLWLTPSNGRKLGPTGNMHVWDYKGISVTYVLLDPQRELRCSVWTASPSEIARHRPSTPHHGLGLLETCLRCTSAAPGRRSAGLYRRLGRGWDRRPVRSGDPGAR